MKPRSVRFREDAQHAGMLGALSLMISIASAVFAHVCRLHEMFWPMMALAFLALGLLFVAFFKFVTMTEMFRASEREAYWENRRFMDRFIHVHRN